MTRYRDTFNNKRNLLFSPRLILYDNFFDTKWQILLGSVHVCKFIEFVSAYVVVVRLACVCVGGGWWLL